MYLSSPQQMSPAFDSRSGKVQVDVPLAWKRFHDFLDSKIKRVGAVRLQQVGDTAAALGTGFQGRIWAEKTFNDARADNGTVSNLPILIT